MDKKLLWTGLGIQLVLNGGIVFFKLIAIDWSFINLKFLLATSYIIINMVSLFLIIIGACANGKPKPKEAEQYF